MYKLTLTDEQGETVSSVEFEGTPSQEWIKPQDLPLIALEELDYWECCECHRHFADGINYHVLPTDPDEAFDADGLGYWYCEECVEMLRVTADLMAQPPHQRF